MAPTSSTTGRALVERNIVGIAFYSSEDYQRASAKVRAEDFADSRLRVLWTVIGDLAERGVAGELGALSVELTRSQRLDDAGGVDFISEVLGAVPDSAHLDDWCLNLRQLRVREALAKSTDKLAAEARGKGQLAGLVSDLQELTEQVEAASKTGVSRLPVMTLDEILSAPEDQMAWLIRELLPRQGVIALGGKQKQGKTLLAQQIGLSIVSNHEALGRDVDNDGAVVFVGLEGSRASFIERIKKQCRGLEIPTNGLPFHLITRPKRERLTIGSPLWTELEALCAAVKPVFVVIDPLVWISDSPESDNDEMSRKVMLPLQQFSVRHDCLVLVIHHLSKPTGDGKAQAPDPGEFTGALADKFRGASSITAGTDGNLVFELLKDENTYRLYAELRDAPGSITYLRRDADSLIYQVTDAPAQQQIKSSRKVTPDKLITWLAANQGEGVAVNEVVAGLDVAWATASAALKAAEDAGQVIRAKVGSRFRFKLAPGVEVPASAPDPRAPARSGGGDYWPAPDPDEDLFD